MDARALHTLEFPKLLEHLAAFAVSDAGAEACRNLLPQTNAASIQEEAEFFLQGRVWQESTGFKLINFPPLAGVLHFMEQSAQALDLDALWTLRQVLGQCGQLYQSVQTVVNQECMWPVIAAFCSGSPLPNTSISALIRCISDDGYLRDEASPELLLARTELRRIHRQCNRKVGEFAKEYNIGHYLQDEFITLSSDRYVLPLKTNFKGRLQGIIHDYSQTGETCYFEPIFLVELNNKLQELKREEREAERKVFIYLSSLLRDELPLLHHAFTLLVRFDVLQAKIRLSSIYAGTMINFTEDARVNLIEARHPLLALTHAMSERAAKTAENNRSTGSPASSKKQNFSSLAPAPVATNITLHDNQKALVISGGNAGGKTVSLKTLGLCAIMGMCGLPVPADKGSTLPIWENILPFIGDDQSLEDHVSTFTAQITGLAGHWGKIDAGSLVILDEFGAGTDPSQGAALAQAVIDELLEKGAFVFAATHFPALKAYAMSKDGVRAASVLFDPQTKKPLYRLVYDQVGASQALEVAREHGLAESILQKARQYLLLDGEDTGQLIERLNKVAVEREQEIASLKRETEKITAKQKTLEERFAKDKEKLFTELQGQAQSILKDWKAAKVTHKQALKSLATVRKNLTQDLVAAPEAPAGSALEDINKLLPGMKVHYLPWGKGATILELDARRKRARIDLSGVSIWAEAANLTLVAPAKNLHGSAGAKGASVNGATGSISTPAVKNYALRLDLRGKRAIEAMAELEQFLDSALLSNRDELEILHGRGTGALRREIHAYLKSHPAVQSFKSANEDYGGDGVTIVILK